MLYASFHGNYTLLMGDCPIETPISSGSPATFDDTRGYKIRHMTPRYPHLVPIWLNHKKIYPEGS